MQQWEYMMIGVVKSYGMNYRANGDKVNDWKDLPLHDIFKKMGKAGYEFCSYDGDSYIFKRPAVNGKKVAS